MLIDTRSSDQYELYSLPGAMSVPLEELIDSTGVIDQMWEGYLGLEDMNTILFSNGDITADQVWVLCTRMGIENLFVMEGGLNRWVETILKPIAPSEFARMKNLLCMILEKEQVFILEVEAWNLKPRQFRNLFHKQEKRKGRY